MLRHEARAEAAAHLQGAAPAQRLAVIVSMGIPVGVACALISFSKTASHRVYIIAAGLAGSVGILCAALLHGPVALMAAMLVTHTPRAQLARERTKPQLVDCFRSGTLQYAVAMIFCEESFPTDIRASATGGWP